jgi:hypothetical protein
MKMHGQISPPTYWYGTTIEAGFHLELMTTSTRGAKQLDSKNK